MLSKTLRWFGALLFTILVPGSVTVALPYYILGRSFTFDRRFWSLPQSGGLALLLVGLAVYVWCLWDFVVAGRGLPSPVDHPKHLVVRGLYRYVRNPMYLGVLGILLGEVLVLRSLALLQYAALWFLIVNVVVRVYEEPNLSSRFGHSYDQYCRQVRRWIPGLPSVRSDVPANHGLRPRR
jgi:protein-S-isoprenylcysteine O-methyltransferase Ste14